MGCGGSSEANAEETMLPPPEWGKPIAVRLHKKGMFDADYDVLVGEKDKWMLLDAVGSMWDDGYKYFLKYRPAGQEESTVLGAVNIQGQYDAFSFMVNGGGQDTEFGPFFDMWDGDVDWGVSSEREIWAGWTYSKRAVLYSDYEMMNQIGWLDITGSGTWHEWEEQRVVWDEDEEGNKQQRFEYDHHQECRTNAFQYSLNIFNTPMVVYYDKVPGGFFKASKMNFTAANAFAPNVPLFKVQSDGEYNAVVTSLANSDPISTLLVAFAISCKLDPKEFGKGAEKMCSRHIRMGAPPGMSEFIGVGQQQFAQRFAYPAPPMPVYAQAVAEFVPSASAQPMVFAQPVV